MAYHIPEAKMKFLILTCGILSVPGLLHCQTSHEDCERRIQELERRLTRVEGLLAKLGTAPEVSATLPSPSSENGVQPPAPAKSFAMPPELVPQIGKIGAEVGLILAGSSSPFKPTSAPILPI